VCYYTRRGRLHALKSFPPRGTHAVQLVPGVYAPLAKTLGAVTTLVYTNALANVKDRARQLRDELENATQEKTS